MKKGVFTVVGIVFFSAAVTILFFIRTAPDDIRITGKRIAIIVLISTMVLLVSTVTMVFLGSEMSVWLRASASMVIAVPLVFFAAALVGLILKQEVSRNGALVPLILTFTVIFTIIYIFASIYYVNGLIYVTSGGAVTFSDSLYFSGMVFTTLGDPIIYAHGIGQFLTVFEAICGFMVIGLMTAIIVQAAISTSRKDQQ